MLQRGEDSEQQNGLKPVNNNGSYNSRSVSNPWDNQADINNGASSSNELSNLRDLRKRSSLQKLQGIFKKDGSSSLSYQNSPLSNEMISNTRNINSSSSRGISNNNIIGSRDINNSNNINSEEFSAMPGSSHTDNMSMDDDDDDENYDDLENVRQCCDGKHDVSKLDKKSHKPHKQGSGHPHRRSHSIFQ